MAPMDADKANPVVSSRNGSVASHSATEPPSQQDQSSGASPIRYNEQPRNGNDGEFTVEDISNQDVDYDDDVEVVRPYQCEEARSDESTAKSVPQRVPKRLEFDEIWKSGLIDSMETLCRDPGPHTQRRLRLQKAGLKRKPSGPGDNNPFSRTPAVDKSVEDPNRRQYVGPNKIRRRNSRGKGTTASLSDSAPESTDKEGESSSIAVLSGETSADESTLNTSQGDPMDID